MATVIETLKGHGLMSARAIEEVKILQNIHQTMEALSEDMTACASSGSLSLAEAKSYLSEFDRVGKRLSQASANVERALREECSDG